MTKLLGCLSLDRAISLICLTLFVLENGLSSLMLISVGRAVDTVKRISSGCSNYSALVLGVDYSD